MRSLSRCFWAAVRPVVGSLLVVEGEEEREGVATLLVLLEEEREEEDEKGLGVLARSARLLTAFLACILSLPLSSLNERIMASISVGASSGCEQNVHGPMPSLTQMILPQLRQLGAAARRGWRVALQEQAREAVGSLVWEGLVWISRARMAESYEVEF